MKLNLIIQKIRDARQLLSQIIFVFFFYFLTTSIQDKYAHFLIDLSFLIYIIVMIGLHKYIKKSISDYIKITRLGYYELKNRIFIYALWAISFILIVRVGAVPKSLSDNAAIIVILYFPALFLFSLEKRVSLIIAAFFLLMIPYFFLNKFLIVAGILSTLTYYLLFIFSIQNLVTTKK